MLYSAVVVRQLHYPVLNFLAGMADRRVDHVLWISVQKQDVRDPIYDIHVGGLDSWPRQAVLAQLCRSTKPPEPINDQETQERCT